MYNELKRQLLQPRTIWFPDQDRNFILKTDRWNQDVAKSLTEEIGRLFAYIYFIYLGIYIKGFCTHMPFIYLVVLSSSQISNCFIYIFLAVCA